ncbi:MAG: SDR family NAD(P)-dependent oxidoreductase [Pseudobdellovibrio sp.]
MYIIVGASSGVGRAISEVFASKGSNLCLVSREIRDTQAIALDLSLRYGVSVTTVDLDLSNSQINFDEVLKVVVQAQANFKGVLIPAGTVTDSDTLSIEALQIEKLFNVNCVSICNLILEVIRKAHKDCEMTFVGFGSVAAARGRGFNMIYSSAKAALQFYFESLRHACVGKPIKVQFYVLGYMDTNLAFAHNLPFPKGDPKKMAEKLYLNINDDIGVVYYPVWWSIIVKVIDLVPWSIYKNLKF